jgi:hypothetical protein
MTIISRHGQFIISLTLLLPSIAAARDDAMPGMDMSASLGQVRFDNSCSPKVRADIDRGVAYLYSFWFPESRRQFETAAQRDPACSVAYWGEAMADYEQIIGGGLPQGAQLKAGLEAIAKAQSAPEKTAREQAYLDAIAIIYAAASIPDHDARVRRYSAAMGAIHAAYPTDNQAAIIYAITRGWLRSASMRLAGTQRLRRQHRTHFTCRATSLRVSVSGTKIFNPTLHPKRPRNSRRCFIRRRRTGSMRWIFCNTPICKLATKIGQSRSRVKRGQYN